MTSLYNRALATDHRKGWDEIGMKVNLFLGLKFTEISLQTVRSPLFWENQPWPKSSQSALKPTKHVHENLMN